ncbi:MAG TPA: hypothetical protein VJB69_02990 [Candidatus Paceibacterota bacterium]
MIIAIISILILTGLVRLINRFLPLSLCPICAGVSGTWAWLLIAHWLAYRIDLTIPALLMGGTVVGSMSKLERFVEPKFVLVWKTTFTSLGFLVAYSLLVGKWLILAGGMTLALIVTLVFKIRESEPGRGNQESKQAEELRKKMENCC